MDWTVGVVVWTGRWGWSCGRAGRSPVVGRRVGALESPRPTQELRKEVWCRAFEVEFE